MRKYEVVLKKHKFQSILNHMRTMTFWLQYW